MSDADERHVGEDRLLAYADGELTARESDRVRHHLAACWSCRARFDDLEAAIKTITQFRNDDLLPGVPPPPAPWAGLEPRLPAIDAELTRTPFARLRAALARRRPFQSLQPREGPGPFQGLPALQARRWLLASSIFLVALVGWLSMSAPGLSAAELLQRASVREQAWQQAADVVVYRELSVEERRRGDARPIARRRVAVWQSAARGLQARRVYDGASRLVAGEWRRDDGVSTIYRPAAAPVIERDAATATSSPTAAEIWRWDLSAAAFARLAGGPSTLRVRRTPDAYVLIADARPGSPLLEASLTLSADGLHARAATLVFETMDGPHEYRVEEIGFQQLAPARVAAARFEPERELLPAPPVPARAPSSHVARALPAPSATPSPTMAASALDRLEIDAWHRLHRAGLAFDERTAVRRDARGTLDVSARVAGELRKGVIEQALAPLAANPLVRLDIESTPDAPDASSPPLATPGLAADAPGYVSLRGGVARRMPFAAIAAREEVARQTAEWALARGGAVRTSAASLRQFVARWPADRLQTLDLDAITKWQQIVREHVLDIGQETEQIRLRLAPLWGGCAAAPARLPPPADLAAIGRDTADVIALAAREDQLLQRALTVGDAGGAFDAGPLCATFADIEARAARFTDPWPLGR